MANASQTRREQREKLRDKYNGQKPISSTQGPRIVNNSAIEPVRNVEQPKPEPESKLSRSQQRDQLRNKYAPAQNTPVSPAPEEIKTKKQTNGIIASPEYFATSVDVRTPRGEFIKTFKGKEPGQAKALADAHAEKIGGSIQVTPAGGIVGQMFNRAQDAFKGAIDNFTTKAEETFREVGSVKEDELGRLVPDDTSTVVSRAASGVDLGVAGIGVLLSPISAAFTAAEEIPVAGGLAKGVNLIFEKVGEGGGWLAGEAVDNIPFISDKTKDDIRPAAENLSALLAQLAVGKAGQKSTQVSLQKTAKIREDIKIKITKDVIETNQLPRTVFVSPESVKSIFQTGDKISAIELELIKSLGMDSKQYKAAIKDGVNIAIPAERIVTIADKPWFAQAKGAFGIKPTSEKVVHMDGKPYRGPETRESRLLEGEKPTKVAPGAPQVVKTPIVKSTKPSKEQVRTRANELRVEMTTFFKDNGFPVSEAGFTQDFDALKAWRLHFKEKYGVETPLLTFDSVSEFLTKSEIKTPIVEALQSPVTPKLLNKIEEFTPSENAAFGKSLVDSINEAVGLKIPEGASKQLPSNVEVRETASGDGRPAQFKNGKIEIFLPDLLGDIKTLMEGKRILAHEGEFSKVYEKLKGESTENLAVRYVRDIIMHEAGHQKTMTLEDTEIIRGLQRDINQAKIIGNETQAIQARKKLSEFMRALEDKANSYVRDNSKAMEKEIFGGERKTQTEIQRKINKATDAKIPSREKVVTTEKKQLIGRIKARAKGAREGFFAGKKEGVEKQTEVARTARQKAAEKIRDSKATLESRKKDAIDYAQILPFRERGKFIKSINNLKSEKDFLNVIARISEASKTVERVGIMKKITKLLDTTKVRIKDGRPSAKLSADKQKIVDKIRSLQSTFEKKAKALRDSGDKEATAYGLAQVEIADKISDWQTKNPDGVLTPELLHETELLRMVGLKDMTVQELSSVLGQVESIIEKGVTKRELDRFNLETERQRVIDKVLDIVKSDKELPSKGQGIKQDIELGKVQKIIEGITNGKTYLVDAFEEILDNISKFDKTSGPYESFISKYGRVVKDSRAVEYRGNKKTIDSINESVKEIYKLDDGEIMQLLSDLREIVDLGKLKLSDGTVKEFKISRGQAMKYSALFKDPTIEATFEKQGWTPEIQKKIESVLTPEDLKMSDWFVDEFYPKYYERINAVHVKDTGVDLPFNEKYTPLHRDVEALIPENVLLAQESAKYATARTGSLKQRVDNKLEIEPIDIFVDAFRHVQKMEHYIAWQENLNNLRSVFGNKDVRRSIRELHGDAKLKFIDNALNDFARGGVAKEKIVGKVDALRINTTKAILGANIKVAAKQLTGVTNYLIELDGKAFFGGVTDFWKNPVKNAQFLFENSELLAERYGAGWERDVKAAMQTGYDKQIAKATNFDELLFIMIRNADKFTVIQGAHASYQEGIAKGMSKEDAIKYAEDVTERIQESSALDTLSEVQRGGSWAKLFTMLMGQQVKYLRVMSNAARNIQYGRGSKVRNTKRFVTAWILAPLIYNWVANELVDDKFKSSNKELLARSILGPITYIPVLGAVGQTIIDRSFGERFNFSASAAFSVVDDVLKSIDQLKIGDVLDAVTHLVDAAGKLKGVPTTVITKPIRKAGREESPSKRPPVSF